jgi:hypothetical protein
LSGNELRNDPDYVLILTHEPMRRLARTGFQTACTLTVCGATFESEYRGVGCRGLFDNLLAEFRRCSRTFIVDVNNHGKWLGDVGERQIKNRMADPGFERAVAS